MLSGLYILHLVLPFFFLFSLEVLSWYNKHNRHHKRTLFKTVLGTITIILSCYNANAFSLFWILMLYRHNMLGIVLMFSTNL